MINRISLTMIKPGRSMMYALLVIIKFLLSTLQQSMILQRTRLPKTTAALTLIATERGKNDIYEMPIQKI